MKPVTRFSFFNKELSLKSYTSSRHLTKEVNEDTELIRFHFRKRIPDTVINSEVPLTQYLGSLKGYLFGWWRWNTYPVSTLSHDVWSLSADERYRHIIPYFMGALPAWTTIHEAQWRVNVWQPFTYLFRNDCIWLQLKPHHYAHLLHINLF